MAIANITVLASEYKKLGSDLQSRVDSSLVSPLTAELNILMDIIDEYQDLLRVDLERKAQKRKQDQEFDSFEIALRVTGADGKINKKENKFLSSLRSSFRSRVTKKIIKKKSGVGTKKRIVVRKKKPAQSSLVSRSEAMKIAYDAANADGKVSKAEIAEINEIFNI